MFDHVGTTSDPEATRRSFVSLLISALMLGGGGAFVAGWTAYTAVQALTDETPVADEALVEVIVSDPVLEQAPPPPPPPAAAPVDDDEPDPVDEPDEMVDDPQELDDDIDQEIANEARPAGEDGGVDGGEAGGKPGGTLGGDPNGCVGCDGPGGGVRAFHHTDLDVKTRVDLEYPAAAMALDLGEQRCRTTVTLDERGVPYVVEVDACPSVFHAAVRESILKWRWYPPKLGREKVQAQTVIMVAFRPR